MESATCCGMESDRSSEWNHGNAVYGIKPQERCTLARDEIQGRNAPLMIYECISRHRRVIHSMIYQACGLDKKILVPKNEDFLAGALGLEPRTNGFGDRDSTN